MKRFLGIAMFIVLTAALYWVWVDGINLILRQVRKMPALRAGLSEFAPMIYFIFVCVVLGLAQTAWDRFSGSGDHD